MVDSPSLAEVALLQGDEDRRWRTRSDGQGIVVYIDPLGTFSFDAFTIIAHNHASTSDDNIFQ